ncbi:MAG: TlyA family RNA methyltransferase [Candidatus Saccharimonadales bacterium]
MSKIRLDQALVARGIMRSRSQAESYIKLGYIQVNSKLILKPGYEVSELDDIKMLSEDRYVSRAALKLASVSDVLQIEYRGKVVLDVGSSTGGFTDYSLQHGARKVIAVDVGTDQLHPSLRNNPSIELHEQTDIRDINPLSETPDIVLIDVSFISIREILPHLMTIIGPKTTIIAMIKPQFESRSSDIKHKGVIKNDAMRRKILKDFEIWVQKYFVVLDKADSKVHGSKGNQERFYKLKKTA